MALLTPGENAATMTRRIGACSRYPKLRTRISVLIPRIPDLCICAGESRVPIRQSPSPHKTSFTPVALVPADRSSVTGPAVSSAAKLTMLTNIDSDIFHALASILSAPLILNPPINSASRRYPAHLPVSTFANLLVTCVKSGVVGKVHMMMPLAPWLILSIVIATSSSGVGVCFQNSELPNACGVPQKTFGGRPS